MADFIKKFLLIILGISIQEEITYSLELQENTILQPKKSVIISSENIEETQQYFGLPEVPLVHHYTNFMPPSILLTIKSNFPYKNLDPSQGVLEKMKLVGINPNDPFLIVVQGFSGILTADGMELEPAPAAPLLLRPMYYFSQNREYTRLSKYIEYIHVKASILGITSNLAIDPDNATTLNAFGVSVHNSAGGGPLVSSANNMAVPNLRYNESTAFYGFYKGVSRTVIGAIKDTKSPDDRGVSMLHVLLNDLDRSTLSKKLKDFMRASSLLGKEVCVKDILNIFKEIKDDNLPGKDFSTLLHSTIENIIDRENQILIQKMEEMRQKQLRYYYETCTLPLLRELCPNHTGYLSYDSFINDKRTCYNPNMNPEEYLETVWMSIPRYKKMIEDLGIVLPKYESNVSLS